MQSRSGSAGPWCPTEIPVLWFVAKARKKDSRALKCHGSHGRDHQASPTWNHGQHSCSQAGRWLRTEDTGFPQHLGDAVKNGGVDSRGQVTLTKFLPLPEKGQLTWKLDQLLKTKDFSIPWPRFWEPRVVPPTSNSRQHRTCWK